MLDELKKNEEKYKIYLDGLRARISCASVSSESNSKNPDNSYVSEDARKLYAYLDAFDYLFSMDGEWMDYSISKKISYLEELIELVTDEEYREFRKTNIIVNGSNVERSSPKMIRNDLMYLFNNYDMMSNGLDPYLREALFHIRFLHIHPFGDGNGRLARLLTTFNFIQNGIAPPLLSLDDKKEYCECIENNDCDRLAKMMEKLSKKEEEITNSLVKSYSTKRR